MRFGALRKVTNKPFDADRMAVNCHHNHVQREEHYGEPVWVTRKGAVRAGADSQSLLFQPRAIKGGDYRFAIGTAGSCTPLLRRMGADIEMSLSRYGFYPAGGEFITAKLTQHTLTNREAINAFVPGCLEMEETSDGMTRIFRGNEQESPAMKPAI